MASAFAHGAAALWQCEMGIYICCSLGFLVWWTLVASACCSLSIAAGCALLQAEAACLLEFQRCLASFGFRFVSSQDPCNDTVQNRCNWLDDNVNKILYILFQRMLEMQARQ